MNPINKNSMALVPAKALFMAGGLLLFAAAGRPNTAAAFPGTYPGRDTLPQADISGLKRADIRVVVVNADSVDIQLKNDNSIAMSRASFEALPQGIRKEISAQNDGVFSNGEVESAYPGGSSGWMSYLIRAFRYPQEAMRSGIQGIVIVQFVVDEQGKLNNIQAISGPTSGGLREEAIRVVKGSGKWEPAVWNGYRVTSVKHQSIIFRIDR